MIVLLALNLSLRKYVQNILKAEIWTKNVRRILSKIMEDNDFNLIIF